MTPHTASPATPASPVSSTSLVTAGAVVLCALLLAALLQFGLLGALGSAGRTDIDLQPVANAQPATPAGGNALRFDASRTPAVAQARRLQLPAGDVLAVSLRTEEVTGPMKLSIGWLTSQNLRRTFSATGSLPPRAAGNESIVLLAGHPRWTGNVTQMALGLERARADGSPATATMQSIEWVPANPLGATRLLWSAWFASDSSVISPNEASVRILPLPLWLAFVGMVSIAATALCWRRDPAKRARALRSVALWLALLFVACTVFATRWPGWTAALGAGLVAGVALMLAAQQDTWALKPVQRAGLVLLCCGISAVLSPMVALVALAPLLVLCVSRHRAPLWTKLTALLAFVPPVGIAAVAQGLLPAPSLLAPPSDPTSALVALSGNASGMPAFALGLLALHRLWPAPARSVRWASGAAAAAVWALVSALCVLAVPKIAALAADSSTFVAIFVPATVCLWLAVQPGVSAVAQSAQDATPATAKSESDLSAQALSLLQSHAERVRTTLARGEIGAAHAALTQMQRIASAAHTTTLAQLRIALADGDLAAARNAAGALQSAEPKHALAEPDFDALLELAHRSNDAAQVIELSARASRSMANQRALAMAQLATEGQRSAVATLAGWSDETVFAREIAELHLLADDVAATQQALVNTGISLNDPVGQTYVARLGMRVQGPAAHADGIHSLALWHPQLAAAHAALGELLHREGNVAGAAARFRLAMKLDPQLWPLQHHLRDAVAGAASVPAPAQADPTRGFDPQLD